SPPQALHSHLNRAPFGLPASSGLFCALSPRPPRRPENPEGDRGSQLDRGYLQREIHHRVDENEGQGEQGELVGEVRKGGGMPFASHPPEDSPGEKDRPSEEA